MLASEELALNWDLLRGRPHPHRRRGTEGDAYKPASQGWVGHPSTRTETVSKTTTRWCGCLTYDSNDPQRDETEVPSQFLRTLGFGGEKVSLTVIS